MSTKIMIPYMTEAQLERLHKIAPDVEFLHPKDWDEAVAMAPELDATYFFCTDAILDAAPKLRWIQVGSAGVERYPLQKIKERNIPFTNAQKIHGIQLADHTMALILAFSRQLPFLLRAQQDREWKKHKDFPSGELSHETLLVVGLGGTGLETARRASGFGMRVLATRRKIDQPAPDFVESVHPPDALHELLPQADWVAVCLPLTDHTRDTFHDVEFDLMKESAYIVCVTRGAIINTEALVRALDTQKIAGAGLDVTDPEPLPANHPLWGYENVIITPHASGHSPHAKTRMFDLFCENLKRFVNNDPLINLVDMDLQY